MKKYLLATLFSVLCFAQSHAVIPSLRPYRNQLQVRNAAYIQLSSNTYTVGYSSVTGGYYGDGSNLTGLILGQLAAFTEATLESRLSDVTNVFTNNDGSLDDDDITDDASTSLTDTASILYETELDSEAELEAQLVGVTNVYTDNDGALDDDDVTLGDVQAATTNDFHNIGGTDATDDTVSGTELDTLLFGANGLLRKTASNTFDTITDNSSNWTTAVGWGDHALAGYANAGTANEIVVAAQVIGIADNPTIPGDEAMIIPGGSTGSRPAGTLGQIRRNSTMGKFEGYISGWNTFILSGDNISLLTNNSNYQTGSDVALATTSAVSGYMLPTGTYTFTGGLNITKNALQLSTSIFFTDGVDTAEIKVDDEQLRIFFNNGGDSDAAIGISDSLIYMSKNIAMGGNRITGMGYLDMGFNWFTNVAWENAAMDDGTGSFLDADLLDGQDSLYFAALSTMSNYATLAALASTINSSEGSTLIGYKDGETLKAFLDDIANPLMLDAITVSDDGGLNISWTTGEIYDTSGNIVETQSGNDTCTDNVTNYLVWQAGDTLTLKTSKATSSEIPIAHISVQEGDVWELHEESIASSIIYDLQYGLAALLPVGVEDGCLVENDTDLALGLKVISGEYYHDAHQEHEVNVIYSSVTPMVVWYHNGGVWESTTSTTLDTTLYDDGTDTQTFTNNKWSRSLAFVSETQIHVVYSIDQYVSEAGAFAAANPTPPSGLSEFPVSVAIVYQEGETDLANATFIDLRPRPGIINTSNPLSDHGSLSGLGDSADHPWAMLASQDDWVDTSGDTMTGVLNMGVSSITATDAALNITTNVVVGGRIEADAYNIPGKRVVVDVFTSTGIINAINSIGGDGEVVLLEGTYTISETIDNFTSSITFTGAGQGLTILKADPWAQWTTPGHMFDGYYVNGVTFQDIWFDGNSANSGQNFDIIHAEVCDNWTITNCRFDYPDRYGIHFEGNNGFKIIDNFFYESDSYGIYNVGWSDGGYRAYYAVISGNSFFDGAGGIRMSYARGLSVEGNSFYSLSGTAISGGQANTACVYSGNAFYNCNIGISFFSGTFNVSNNNFYNCTSYSLSFYGVTSGQVVSNSFYSSGQHAIRVNGGGYDCVNVVIANNTFDQTANNYSDIYLYALNDGKEHENWQIVNNAFYATAGQSEQAIELQAGVEMEDVIISGNISEGHDTAFMNLTNGCTNIYMLNNIIDDPVKLIDAGATNLYVENLVDGWKTFGSTMTPTHLMTVDGGAWFASSITASNIFVGEDEIVMSSYIEEGLFGISISSDLAIAGNLSATTYGSVGDITDLELRYSSSTSRNVQDQFDTLSGNWTLLGTLDGFVYSLGGGVFTSYLSTEIPALTGIFDSLNTWTSSQTFEGGIASSGAVIFDLYEPLARFVIHQNSLVGVENQMGPVFIDDDRTGSTANEAVEAAVVIDAEGVYALYVMDGVSQFVSNIRITAGDLDISDNNGIFWGVHNDWRLEFDTNGSEEDVMTQVSNMVDGLGMQGILEVDTGHNPASCKDVNGMVLPTRIITFADGGDANDTPFVFIGGMEQSDVSTNWAYRFVTSTGALDGSVDATTQEQEPYFQFGRKSAIIDPTHIETSSGSVHFLENIEVDGSIFGDSDVYANSEKIDQTIYLDNAISVYGSTTTIGTNPSRFTPFYRYDVTIQTITVQVVGGTSVIGMIEMRPESDLTSAGTDIWGGDVTAVLGSWTGGAINDFTIPAGYALFFVPTTWDGAVDSVQFTGYATKD